MKQKQSQRVVVNIHAPPKPKRKRRAKKTPKRQPARQPTRPQYMPMPQSTIRYYDNPLPQRQITITPPPAERPRILQGIQAETEYEQPVSVARKPIKVKTPQPETEHVLLREEEPVSLGGEEAPSARDVIEEQGNVPAREQPAEKPKRKISPLEATQELPTTQLTFTPAQPAEEPQENDIEKPKKERTTEPEWYKKVKKDFERANKAQKEYDIRQLGLIESEAQTAYKQRRRNYIDSIGTDTSGFTYVEAPSPNIEASGGGFSFV